jgi:hypothetical protein
MRPEGSDWKSGALIETQLDVRICKSSTFVSIVIPPNIFKYKN